MSSSVAENIEQQKHCLIFDPIPFSGGSKIATREAAYRCLQNNVKFTILTASTRCWNDTAFNQKHSVSFIKFYCPQYLLLATTGWKYRLKQAYFCLLIFYSLLKIAKVQVAIGASGPGVDMALYLCQRIFRYRLIQLIHGPVGISRSIGYCLTRANTTFYLQCCRPSMLRAMAFYYNDHLEEKVCEKLASFNLASPHYFPFKNGISKHNWPTPCFYGEPTVFWAASLLKWKGLDTLVHAEQILSAKISIKYHVCFIRPKHINLDISNVPAEMEHFQCYDEPRNLDEIRSKSNIFVSTSCNEPFGLSVLEALAAGMCVLIPKDGSYWDKTLTHNVNCIKYRPGSAASLANALFQLTLNPVDIVRIGLSALKISERYHAETCYQKIVDSICSLSPSSAPSDQLSSR